MRSIFFLLKLAEAILSLACVAIHIRGIVYKQEPLPHEMFFCGTYFSFMLISIFGCLGLCLQIALPMVLDSILCGVASFCFLFTSILSMMHVENDFHLMYLTDREEWLHPFLYISREQSIVSLFTGLFFMMHTVLLADMLIITDVNPNEDDPAYQPIKLNYICEPIEICCVGCLNHCKILKKQRDDVV